MGKKKSKKDQFAAQPAQAADEAIYGGSAIEEDMKAQLAEEFAEIKRLENQEIKPGELHVGNFVLDTNQLELRYYGEGLTRDQWLDMGKYLKHHEGTIQWMIGDWALMAEPYLDEWVDENDELYQEIRVMEKDVPAGKYQWLAAQTDYSYSSLTKFKHYAEMFPAFRRRKSLTYSHHVQVASLPKEDQERLLDEAVSPGGGKERLSVRELKRLAMAAAQIPYKRTANPNIHIMYRINDLREALEPKRWHKLSAQRQQEIYHELRTMLGQIEELGFKEN